MMVEYVYVKLTRCHNALWLSLGAFSFHVFSNEVSMFHTQFSSGMSCDHKGSRTPAVQREVCLLM